MERSRSSDRRQDPIRRHGPRLQRDIDDEDPPREWCRRREQGLDCEPSERSARFTAVADDGGILFPFLQQGELSREHSRRIDCVILESPRGYRPFVVPDSAPRSAKSWK